MGTEAVTEEAGAAEVVGAMAANPKIETAPFENREPFFLDITDDSSISASSILMTGSAG